ncbi:4,5-DOPA dioxygenase extradiol [bacterium]|nr:4,5-DOPA dioxygenase extradiol [bacterium]
MKRSDFIKSLCLAPLAGPTMKLKSLNSILSSFEDTSEMPVMFMGHGSPMNAIEENEFVKGFRKMGEGIPKPAAVLCISAHWETRGTHITAMENPRTIHDFGGFPKELFEVQYPAKGDPELAKSTADLITKTEVGLDHKWGLDHGAWSVIKHLYPNANIPVIQMSLDRYQNPQYHYELAAELAALRKKGILIIGSGNMVHNLGMVAWDKLNEDEYGYDWALEASNKMKQFIEDGDHKSLINYTSQGKAFDLAIPTAEHYLPLLYTLALKGGRDKLSLFNDKAIGGSLTMTSIKIESEKLER